MCLHLTWLLVGTLASVMAKQLVFSAFMQSAATSVGHAVLIPFAIPLTLSNNLQSSLNISGLRRVEHT